MKKYLKEYRGFCEQYLNTADLNISDIALDNFFENEELIEKCYEKSIKLTIGAAILVKNQEKRIRNAVEDAFIISDNVVVCDTGSTDRTLEVLRSMSTSYPLQIECFEWEENYALMRNKSTSFLDTDWIFILDSDERIETKIDKQALKFCLAFLEMILESAEIVLSVRQKAVDIDGIGYPQRIFKNISNLKFYGFVHEELRSENLIEIRSRITLFNEGTSITEREKFNKQERYDKLLLRNIAEEPENIKWFALLSEVWVFSNLAQSQAMIDKLIGSVKSNIPSRDFFEIKLYSVYILLLIMQDNSDNDIFKEIEFAKSKFFHNPIFYYYEYLLKLKEVDIQILDSINRLRGDIDTIKNGNHDEWDIYFPIISLECALIKLLMKCEKYDLALDIYRNNREKLIKTGLIRNEAALFDRIIN